MKRLLVTVWRPMEMKVQSSRFKKSFAGNGVIGCEAGVVQGDCWDRGCHHENADMS